MVKTLAQRTTRRWVLGGLSALVLTARGRQVSIAQDPPKPDGKKCNTD